jgi:hypothetical protein
MALGMIFIALALSLVILENFVTDGKRTREEETIWRGEQYQRAVRLYYHKMGRYPQTVDDLKKGGLNLHFLRQEYKNPMNKTDGTWRFIYVNAAGQIIGSTRYNNLQQMVLIDQYAGLIPGAATAGTMPAQGMGVSAASLASTSGIAGFGGIGAAGGLSGASLQQQQQLQTVLAGILNPGDTTPDPASSPTQLPPLSDSSQYGNSQAGTSSNAPSDNTTAQSDSSQSGAPPQLPGNLAGQLPPGVTQDQVNQFLQNGQLPAGITPDQVAQYVQGMQLPPGVTQDQITQYIQNLQNAQQGGGSSPNPQNPTQQNGQVGFGSVPGQSGQSGIGLTAGQPSSLSFGSSSQGSLGLSPLLAMKPTGPVDSPVLGAFFTGVACTTDTKGVKVYRRAKKYKDWEFIWNPLEDALAAAQQPGGGQQGGLLPGQAGATPGGSSLTNSFGSSSGISIGSGTSGSGSFGSSPQQPQQQQPQ